MELDNRVTGKSRITGIIGSPVEHSISPQLHNTISRCLGLDIAYVPFRVEKHELENAVKGLSALNMLGFNVTLPYKREIIKHLGDVSETALIIGAVNTVKNEGGILKGFNTDADGFYRSFEKEAGMGLNGKRVYMLGAGGAARAIAVKAAEEGAERIYISNRSAHKAIEIANLVYDRFGAAAEYVGLEGIEAVNAFRDSEVVINTTSVGMAPNIDENPLAPSFEFREGQVAYDVIYAPCETKFLKTAGLMGAKTVNGLGMLVYQGVKSYELWTGVDVPDELVSEIIIEIKRVLYNIGE